MKSARLMNHTSHPHVETDGTAYNVGQSIGFFGPKYSVYQFPPNKINNKGIDDNFNLFFYF